MEAGDVEVFSVAEILPANYSCSRVAQATAPTMGYLLTVVITAVCSEVERRRLYVRTMTCSTLESDRALLLGVNQ